VTRAEHTIEIRRPIGDVFGFLTDPRNTVLWQPAVIEARRLTEEPIAVGSRFVYVRRLLGTDIPSTLEVTELVPPRRSAVRIVDGPVTGEGSYTLREVPGATELRLAYHLEAAGFLRVAEQLVTRVLVREFEASLGHLKDLLEARVGA
jgi:uncharacterized protein YndB with AHSA1/START domain